jgi:uncharacterized protein
LPAPILTLCGLLLSSLAASWAFGSFMVRARGTRVSNAKPPACDLKIASDDGVSLAATYWPGRDEHALGIAIFHGFAASREDVAANAAWFSSSGYAVLTVDLRGHGQSTPARCSFGLKESTDAATAVRWLKQAQNGSPVVAIGISLGGAACLLGDEPIAADALVLQAVYPDIRRAIRNRIATFVTAAPARVLEPLLSFQSKIRFGVWPGRLSPLAGLARFPGPVLVLGGGADSYTPPFETRELFEAAAGPKRLWIAENLDHAATANLETEAYRDRILDFVRRDAPPLAQTWSAETDPPRG